MNLNAEPKLLACSSLVIVLALSISARVAYVQSDAVNPNLTSKLARSTDDHRGPEEQSALIQSQASKERATYEIALELLSRSSKPESVKAHFSTIEDARQVLPVVESLNDDLNWAVLQTAIDEAGKTGSKILIPTGTYLIGRGLVVNENGFLLVGEGTRASYAGPNGGVVLRFHGLKEPAIQSIGEMYPPQNRKTFGMENIFIVGVNCNSDGVRLKNNQRYGWLRNVQIDGFKHGAGLSLNHTWVGRYYDLTLMNNKIGLLFTGSSVLAQDFHSCYIGHNDECGVKFDSGVASCINFFGGQIEGNGATQKNGCQISLGPFNRGITLHGTWHEWGNRSENPLIRVTSDGLSGSRSTMTFSTPFFDQRNSAALVRKQSSFGDITLIITNPNWGRRNGKKVIDDNVPINGTKYRISDVSGDETETSKRQAAK